MKKMIWMCLYLLVGMQMFANADVNINDKRVWKKLLQDHKFEILDKEFDKLQKEYENDPNKEIVLSQAFQSFENSDTLLEKDIALWIKQHPDSNYAHLASALYHFHIGWLCRGYRWRSETREKQFAKMKAYFRKAKEEMLYVIEKNPKQTVAYTSLLDLLATEGQKEEYRRYLKEALHHNPLSFLIRRMHLIMLQPKWGGSLEEIKAFMKETEKLYPQNSLLKKQEGFYEFAQGEKILSVKNRDKSTYRRSLPYFTQAIEKNPYHTYLERRADIYYYLKEYPKALTDYQQALRDDSQSKTALIGLAKWYWKQKQYKTAMQYADKTVEIDSMNPYALSIRGKIYYDMDRMDDAMQDLIDSLTYGYYLASTHKLIGYIYYSKKNYRLAAEELKIALQLGSHSSYLWYLLTAAQWHNKDCEFVKSAAMYEKKCKENGDCQKEKLIWALKSAEFAKNRGICK